MHHDHRTLQKRRGQNMGRRHPAARCRHVRAPLRPYVLAALHRLGSGFFHHHVLVLCLSPAAKALVAIDASETHNLGYWRLDDLRRLARLKKEKQEHQISAREAHAHWGGMASNDVASDDLRTKERKPAACRRAAGPPRRIWSSAFFASRCC